MTHEYGHALEHESLAHTAIDHAEDHRAKANQAFTTEVRDGVEVLDPELQREMATATLLTQMAIAHSLAALVIEVRLLRGKP